MTNGGRLLKRGDTYDIECWRTSHRLRVGQSILRGLGLEPTWPEHAEDCMNHPNNRFNRIHGYSYPCLGDCPHRLDPPATWPEWATDEMFDLAYRLADETQTERGNWHQRQINEERREREARAREEKVS